MKRPAVLLACAALCACSTPTAAPPANLVSPQALARSGDKLFVSSTNSDELRVLDLSSNPDLRVFESAPNPLYVLSVPVVSRPVALAADDDGHGTTGNYVFAISAVSSRLGVVVAADEKEEAEVALPGTPMSVVARTAADGSGGATAYVGVSLGDGRGAIVTVDVPGNLAGVNLAANVAYDLGAAAPGGLALSPDGSSLAIGDRLADEQGGDAGAPRGGLILLDLKSGATQRVMVGGPVSKVVYSPEAQRPAAQLPDAGTCAPDAGAPAGQYLYALVESANCPLGQRCGGIQTLVDGQVPTDDAGVPLPPAHVPGAPTDLAVGASTLDGGNLGLGGMQCPNLEPVLLLAVPSTNGFVYFLDGQTGQLEDLQLSTPDAGPVGHFQGDGGLVALDDGTGPLPGTIFVAHGGVETQTIEVAYQGVLPALSGRPAVVLPGDDGGAGQLLSDPAADFVALGVQDLDEVTFENPPANCPATAVVIGVAPGTLTIRAGADIDPSCFPVGGPATYTVQVGTPGAPYLVAGTVAGYLGRTNDASQSSDGGAFFAVDRPYFWRGDGPTTAPPLSFSMGSGDRASEAYWVFSVQNGISPNSAGGGSDAIQPGPVVWVPALKKFYVGYPGSQLGSHLAEIDPLLITPGTSVNVGELQ